MLGLSKENWDECPDVHKAFKEFVYRKTGWKIITSEGDYHGQTKERFKIFKAGYDSATTTKKGVE